MKDYKTIPLELQNIFAVGRELDLKSKDSFPFAGMWLFTGQQGSGKTLLMMHMVQDIMAQCPNCIIISNINIFGVPCIPYMGIEDFEKYNNGQDGIIFVIDEIHILFNSLESKNMPLSTMQVWAQNRKNRRLILGTSQRFNRVSKGVREQTTWNYECTRPLFNRIYSYRVYDGSDYDDKGNFIGELPNRNFYIPRVSAMRMYNTLEVVNRATNS